MKKDLSIICDSVKVVGFKGSSNKELLIEVSGASLASVLDCLTDKEILNEIGIEYIMEHFDLIKGDSHYE